MNKNLNETMNKYLAKAELFVKITVDFQKLIIEGYELDQISKEEVGEFFTRLEELCSTKEIEEAGERFDELFGDEIAKVRMERTYSEEG